MKNTRRTVDEWKNSICKYPEKENLRLQRACEWIVLRPNDEVAMYGKESFENKVKAVEQLLDTEKYINSELRTYYYDMKENEHDFRDFSRWKNFGKKSSSSK